ncbi:1404_t:CDS:2, partial [Rhizophagus irregularis]
MEFINAPIGHNNLTTESHSQAYYKSRLLNFTSKQLNEILESKNSQTSIQVSEMLESNDLNECMFDLKKLVITPNITEAYLDGFKIDKVYPSSGFNLISIIPLFIVNEQATIVYYSPIIFSKYVYSLVGELEEEFIDFNAHTDHILTNLSTPNTTMLILRPVSKDLPQFYQASVDSLAFCQEFSYFYLEQLRDFLQTCVNHLCTECQRN